MRSRLLDIDVLHPVERDDPSLAVEDSAFDDDLALPHAVAEAKPCGERGAEAEDGADRRDGEDSAPAGLRGEADQRGKAEHEFRHPPYEAGE
jgi:hypothetical protein